MISPHYIVANDYIKSSLVMSIIWTRPLPSLLISKKIVSSITLIRPGTLKRRNKKSVKEICFLSCHCFVYRNWTLGRFNLAEMGHNKIREGARPGCSAAATVK